MKIQLSKDKIKKTLIIIGILMSMGTGLGLVSLYFGAGSFIMPMFLSYFKVPLLPVLNILPILLLIFLLYFIFNRIWVSFLLTAFITLGLSWINFFKLAFRNDPLLASDLMLFNESRDMAGRYNIRLNWLMILVIVICVVITGLAYLFANHRIHLKRYRFVGLTMVVVLSGLLFNGIYMNTKVLAATENFTKINRWNATQVYISRGFIYPFIDSIRTSIDKAPTGYDKQEAKDLLAAYTYEGIDPAKKVNVIAFMCEAYNDFSKFDEITFKEPIYDDLHEIESEAYTGELMVNVFAGGTVTTERSFLTGYSALTNFRKKVNSYVSYFKEQGYTVEGSHPGYDWFYNRRNVNQYLGFDRYFFLSNHYKQFYTDHIIEDAILVDETIRLYNANKEMNKPYFSFNVTYQNHGPYSTEKLTDVAYVENKGYTEAEYNILNNYFDGIAKTTKELKRMVDYFKSENEPVVIIVFGDHNPWLGDNNSVYDRLGINLDLSTQEGFENYYCTPYFIWANDAAKRTLDSSFQGEGPTIGPYFLMNEFFKLAHYKGNEYMQLSTAFMKVTPLVHNKQVYLVDGNITETLEEEAQESLRQYLEVQYYLRNNFTVQPTNN